MARNKAYHNWSACQAGMGVIVIGLGVAAILMECKYSERAVPLWSGAWFMISGFFGMSAARNTTNTCLTGGHVVLCIIGIVYSVNMAVLFATASAEEELQTSGGTPLQARIAVDICLIVTGVFNIMLSARCMCYACRSCGSGELFASQHSRRTGTVSREIEVVARNVDTDIPQTPSTIMEPPSYAYVNSLAPQSYEIRFANGDYPSAPPHADEPPSYSEVTAAMATNNAADWTPTSLQIQISYSPAAASGDNQTTESQNGQSPEYNPSQEGEREIANNTTNDQSETDLNMEQSNQIITSAVTVVTDEPVPDTLRNNNNTSNTDLVTVQT